MGAEHFVIAIDGPAASGKSTVAKRLAQRLQLVYVNTGAQYRGVAYMARQAGISPDDTAGIVARLAAANFECGVRGTESSVVLDGQELGPELVAENVTSIVSQVAAIPEVRQRLVALQRAYAEQYDIVMEGRDIGSVVFPHTPYKFYIDANEEVRAARRSGQGLQDSIQARDKADSTRATAPLVVAEGAQLVDSSYLTVDGVVGEVIGRLKLKGLNFVERPWSVAR